MTKNSSIKGAALALAVTGGCICAVTARSQQLDYGAMEQLFGEPVTMSVTGSPQRESDVPATMKIVTADEIRRTGARDLIGVVRHVVGLDVLHTSNDHGDIGVRGYNQSFSPRLLVLVDGRQVYADYYGFTPWATIPVELEAIRQIEIVKGPNSALFGFNAVGGVINIVTYSPVHDSANGATLRAGSQGLVQAEGVRTWRFGESSGLRISAGRRSNDDFATPLGPADGGARRGNQREAFNIRGEVGVSEKVAIGVEGTYSAAQHPELGPVYAMGHTQYRTQSLKTQVSADTRIGWVEGSIYQNETKADIYTGTAPDAFLTFHNDVTVASVRGISKLGADHTLRLTAEHRDNSLPTTPTSGAEVGYQIASIGGMWEWRVTPQWTFTTAARWDRWELERHGFLPPGYGFTNADWNLSRTEPSFNLGAVWRLGDADTLRFVAGRGVQVPSLMNLGGFLLSVPFLGYFSGVPDLEPTVVSSYEVTWDRTLPLGTLRLAAFRGRTEDVTAATGGVRFAGTTLTPANVGDSSTSGIELGLEAAMNERWRWGVGATYQRIDDDFVLPVAATFTDFQNTTPSVIVLGNLGWSEGRWELDGYLRYQSSFDGIIANGTGGAMTVPIGSYVALDGRAAFTLNDRMTLAISGQNLNRSEQRQTAAPMVERQVVASFAVSF